MSLAKVFATSVTGQSSTYTNLAGTKGQLRAEGGNLYRLAKAGAAIAAQAICKFSAYDGTLSTADGGMTVITATDTFNAVVGMNATGSAITSGNYFWMLIDGIAVCTGDGSVAAGGKIMPHATDGSVDTYASNANESNGAGGNVFIGIALENDAADPYPVVCWFKAGAAGNALAA
jgi:hypothetical protein